MKQIAIADMVSTTNAADLGFLALADVAAAAADIVSDEWRIIGGHMVQLLIHVYPTPGTRLRGTADADAGVSTEIAASRYFHDRLRGRDYTDESGNRYVRDHPVGRLAVDILVPDSARRGTDQIGGRGFDPAPGLRLALAAPPLRVVGHVRLTSGDRLPIDVRIPDVEAAVVLKALAWQSRGADKDLVDLAGLFEIVHAHRDGLLRWELGEQPLRGARGDTVRALRRVLGVLDRGQIRRDVLGHPPARSAALIREHVALR
ncbi:hypothetical protein [Nocardia takedensis]|uniref:hypothetical protein n=1 Tax=Nocardia takedensis TaxID=259390 RepID=UPI0003102965|nr:hypothetical protein [Nocardia takedensis]